MQAKGKDLEKILSETTYEVLPGLYKYAQLKELPSDSNHFAIVQDADEVTVVTNKPEALRGGVIHPSDYALVATNVSVPFYSVGYLAAISDAVASKGMNILILSTFSKDYFLVKHEELDKAQEAIQGLGLTRKSAI